MDVEEEEVATVKTGAIRAMVAPTVAMARAVTAAVMTVTVTIITAAVVVMVDMADMEATITQIMVNTPTGIS